MLPPAPVTSTTRLRIVPPTIVLVELHRLAAEEVLDRDLADPRQVHLVADDLVDARDDLGVEPGVAAQLGDAADLAARTRSRS